MNPDINVVVTNPQPLPVVISNSTPGAVSSWQYTTRYFLNADTANLPQAFNDLSQQGWEYVNGVNLGLSSALFIFRKPAQKGKARKAR